MEAAVGKVYETYKDDHARRVRRELRQCGATPLGIAKFSGRYLPTIIQDDEHIEAVIYGRYKQGAGLLSLTEGWLIATDRRVLFLDHKPGYTSMEEMGYDAVTGIQKTTAGLFSAVTLYTKINNYTIRYANVQCVENFLRKIETKRLEKSRHGFFMQSTHPQQSSYGSTLPGNILDEKCMVFLRSNETGVLSTLGRDGDVHGAVVHYLIDENNLIYILTKGDTQKAHDIFYSEHVALTVVSESSLETVQVQGIAEIEVNPEVKNWVFHKIVKPRQYQSGVQLPPVANLHGGAYLIIRITPLSGRYVNFTENTAS